MNFTNHTALSDQMSPIFEQSQTDQLFEQIKKTRLIASTIWFSIAILGLIGEFNHLFH